MIILYIILGYIFSGIFITFFMLNIYFRGIRHFIYCQLWDKRTQKRISELIAVAAKDIDEQQVGVSKWTKEVESRLANALYLAGVILPIIPFVIFIKMFIIFSCTKAQTIDIAEIKKDE